MIPAEILDAIHVTLPCLEVQKLGDDKVVVRNDVVGTRFEGSHRFLDLLDAFRTPKPLGQGLAELECEPHEILPALMSAFIMDIDLLVPTVRPSVGRELKVSEYLKEENAPEIVIFGAPVDSAAAGRGGARFGPSEIRAVTGLPWHADSQTAQMANPFQMEMGDGERVYLDMETRRKYSGALPYVADLGDIRLVPGESIHTYGTRIEMVTSLIAAKNGVPVMFGGDHSVTCFVLDALFKKYDSIGIIHFDAHHDLWQPFAPHMDYITHATPFIRALKSKSLKVLHQLGLRVYEPVFDNKLHEDKRVTYASAMELQDARPESVFESLPRDIPYYLTFDIDCIDPTFAPETGTPFPGGLTPYQAMKLVDYAAREFNIIGWDIVEVGQREHQKNGAALTASMLMKQLLLGRLSYEPMTTYCRYA